MEDSLSIGESCVTSLKGDHFLLNSWMKTVFFQATLCMIPKWVGSDLWMIFESGESSKTLPQFLFVSELRQICFILTGNILTKRILTYVALFTTKRAAAFKHFSLRTGLTKPNLQSEPRDFGIGGSLSFSTRRYGTLLVTSGKDPLCKKFLRYSVRGCCKLGKYFPIVSFFCFH